MKKLISLILTALIALSAMSVAAAFNDIDDGTLSWAGEAINYLSDKAVINGYGDGTFRPENNVTRAEFAKMISLSFDLKPTEQSFKDIEGHWAYDYILSAAPVLFGTSNTFNPDENATREFIAYGLVEALGLKVKDVNSLNEFTDGGKITLAIFDALAAAVENGIIKGYEDNTLRPQAAVTRAEAATLIYRAIGLKDSSGDAQTPDIPSKPETPETPEVPEKPDDGMEHIYTLYPGRNLLLVSGVTVTYDDKNEEEAYKLRYYLADGEEEYSSVIPGDIAVEGTRSSVEEIKSGDVLLMDTAWHGQVDRLYALASFGETTPVFGNYTSYGKKEKYTFEYGKVTDLRTTSKNTILTIEHDSSSKEIIVKSDLDAYVCAPWKNTNKWAYDGVGSIDPSIEDVYVFVRYTDGVSTEIVISDITR